jgi:hypothetical protein
MGAICWDKEVKEERKKVRVLGSRVRASQIKNAKVWKASKVLVEGRFKIGDNGNLREVPNIQVRTSRHGLTISFANDPLIVCL